MFRLSALIVAIIVVVLAAAPFGHSYVATRGSIESFGPGAACTPQGCPPISASVYPAPMPTKISKCKVPAQMCAPDPCMPMPCGPMPCPPMQTPTVWY